MEHFDLPKSTLVNRVIPKNAFDQFTNTKLKRQFTELVDKIRWTHKISTETVNLPFKELQEIQLFEITLKVKEDINAILAVIDKAIPYSIIFMVRFGSESYYSAAQKHAHPTKESVSVIDWTFTSPWSEKTGLVYELRLMESIDFVFHDFCRQLAGVGDKPKEPIATVIEREKQIEQLKKDIKRLETAIASERQFNRKVEMNVQLKKASSDLEALSS